jgi:hypothetical protein
MLDPFVTLAEAGFSQQGELITAAGDHWSQELIVSLDWLRIAELVRAIASHSGCELARSVVLEDGSVVFAMIERPTTAHPQRALVKIAGWNEWGATPTSVMHFAREILTANKARGILVSPGGFTPAALLAAQEHRIETVDASALYAVLQGLPAERSDFFFTIATAGDCSTPTCPVCLQKLSRVESVAQSDIPDCRVFEESCLIAEPVHAQRVEVAARTEATFLHEVKAREIVISGDAFGDFLCEGPVTLMPGGTLSGSVAARSLKVHDGAELLGSFRILSGPPQSFITEIRRWHWLCRSDRRKAECERVLFEPHGK